MPEPDSPLDDGYEWDPTFLNCRREALTALGIWFLAFSWTVPFCYLNGYPGAGFQPGDLSTVFGIPSWTFWGVVAPWLVCDVVTIWFCFFYMRDDHLGDAPEEHEPVEAVASTAATGATGVGTNGGGGDAGTGSTGTSGGATAGGAG